MSGMNNTGKKYKKHTRTKTVPEEVKTKIAVLYFAQGWKNWEIHAFLKKQNIEISDTYLRKIITEERRVREEISREVLKEEYHELFKGEKEKVFFEIDFFTRLSDEIWEKMPAHERNSFKAWAKANEFRFKARDQLLAFVASNKEIEKAENIDDAIKSLEEKLKLDGTDKS